MLRMLFSDVLLLITIVRCAADTTVTVSFEVSAMGARLQYHESGIAFTTTNAFLLWRGEPAFNPSNGTFYLDRLGDGVVSVSSDSGENFSLLSLDLAKHATYVTGTVTAHFIGYRQDGSIVTTDFRTDSTEFQTFTFSGEFSGLTRADITSSFWCIDNLVVVVPEPSTATLLGITGTVAVSVFRRRAAWIVGSRDVLEKTAASMRCC